MHGLVNRAIQGFVRDTYGAHTWVTVTRSAGLDFVEFEAMLTYPASATPKVLDAAALILARTPEDLMEDIGTYLVSNPKVEALRRLLRFGGETFVEFLYSLEELSDRARLAVADLHLPSVELHEHEEGGFSLSCAAPIPGFGHFWIGVLRAMADDYGALVVLEHDGTGDDFEIVNVSLIESEYAEGRQFSLGSGVYG